MARLQTNRHAGISTPLGDDALLLMKFTGSEQLGRPFRFEVELASENHDIAFSDIVGRNVTVRLDLGAGKTRYFNGFVSRFQQKAPLGTLARYDATIDPWLWFLTRTADCRIFQNMTIPEIIMQVFRDHGFTDFQESLTGDYPEVDYCVQYRETDFNFVSRLMEEQGIDYFFDHSDGQHLMILTDSLSAREPYEGYETIEFHPPSDDQPDGQCITSWLVQQQVQPGGYALNDYDFTNPGNELEARATVPRDHAVPDFMVYDYPGRYREFADGEKYAKIRIEEIQSQFETIRAESLARGLAAGRTFTLAEHPRDGANREYLITSVHHRLTSDVYESDAQAEADDRPLYSCEIEVLDVQEPFRPARITPKPLIRGPQTAVVVGEAGERVWTDEHGRVKVQFHWDRYGSSDQNSSCWVRVSQNWAGKNWGGMFIPHIGQEVIVEFLEGDPDRPIITGRVYNADNMPPFDLPHGKELSIIRDVYGNQVTFDSRPGNEHLSIYSPSHSSTIEVGKSINMVTRSDQKKTTVGNSISATFGNSASFTMGASAAATVGATVSGSLGFKASIDLGGSVSFFGGFKLGIELSSAFNFAVNPSIKYATGKEYASGSKDKYDHFSGPIRINSDEELLLIGGPKDEAAIEGSASELTLQYGTNMTSIPVKIDVTKKRLLVGATAAGLISTLGGAAALVGANLSTMSALEKKSDPDGPDTPNADKAASLGLNNTETAASTGVMAGVGGAVGVVGAATAAGLLIYRALKKEDKSDDPDFDSLHDITHAKVTLDKKGILLNSGDSNLSQVEIQKDGETTLSSKTDAWIMATKKVYLVGKEVIATDGKFMSKNLVDAG